MQSEIEVESKRIHPSSKSSGMSDLFWIKIYCKNLASHTPPIDKSFCYAELGSQYPYSRCIM